ncbi:MAG: hypothetical protein AAB974_03535, partial [Patescibacteria group bacterium]
MPERGGEEFLKEKYGLHKSPEVEEQAQRTEKRTGEKVPQDPAARIENYLDRFKEIVERTDPKERERGVEAIKHVLLKKFVTALDEIPESYWKSQEKILRERGEQGDYDRLSEEQKNALKKELAGGLLDDQRSSLEQWIDYLASDDSSYLPDHLKYWVFRSIASLQEFDKEKKEYPKRSKGTVKMFPDINHEALAYVVDMFQKKQQGTPVDFEKFHFDLTEEQKREFAGYLKQENFAKLYAFANELISPIPEHLLPVTEGQWVVYKKGKESAPLVASIRGKGTGWCTAGENTARAQLQGGDFHLYSTLDDDGAPSIPRIAIRMEGAKIAEVRGIAAKQNLDPFMGEVVQKKLAEFPEGEAYEKKVADMKHLTVIERKAEKGESLTKDDLAFLYEINGPIEGFGNRPDPRAQELRNKRDAKADASIVLQLAP